MNTDRQNVPIQPPLLSVVIAGTSLAYQRFEDGWHGTLDPNILQWWQLYHSGCWPRVLTWGDGNPHHGQRAVERARELEESGPPPAWKAEWDNPQDAAYD